MDTNILMESGTNELEVLEFTIGNNHYGINVAKVREIVPYAPVTPVPHAHECVEGIFMPRDTMITVINLARVIKAQESDDTRNDMFIITNFNKLNVGFHVHKVLGIHRISWADIITPDKTISTADTAISTGIVKIDNKLIIILDFESIVSNINPETGLKVSDVEKLGTRERCDSPIVMAEDSPLLTKLIMDSLHKAGYSDVTACPNGQACWDLLTMLRDNGSYNEKVKCIITDIEMPLMDGHRLTKLIKEDERLKNIPVIIFSSLIDDQMRAKGTSLGADEQLSKPEIGQLVSVIDRLIAK
ncbi:MAG: chemotaxis protein [Lachnospiraceae bacterium]|nr:chemotaxis protein [Lachnospiraceae bacterium]